MPISPAAASGCAITAVQDEFVGGMVRKETVTRCLRFVNCELNAGDAAFEVEQLVWPLFVVRRSSRVRGPRPHFAGCISGSAGPMKVTVELSCNEARSGAC